MTTLWPHQDRALAELDAAIRSGERRICLTSPTGGGKTRMAIERLETSGVPSVFYTHRKMLLSQTSSVFTAHGIPHGLRAAGHDPRLLEDIQIAMVQTEAVAVLKKQRRDVHNAKEILVDEAHNNAAGTAQQLLELHDGVVIGLTATPLGIGHIYDHLIVAGTNRELRDCGAHVPAYTFGPDEPDTKLVGKIAIGEGECGIAKPNRMRFAHRVFGRVIQNWQELNPEGRPALLFAPGVDESVWFAETLCANGIPAAHIDGKNCWLDGELIINSQEARDEIAERSKAGDLKIVCNRFVLREGVDWPWIHHGILATVFGSLTSYLQAGGRLLRSHPSMDKVIVQDHGGNWWRHGSLNADQDWDLTLDDRIVGNLRLARIREKQEREPIHCPKCNAIRLHGAACHQCGYQHQGRRRPVLQADGSLREMANDTFRARRYHAKTKNIEREWVSRINAIRRSKKPTVARMTFAQADATFARDNCWKYAPRDLPQMPKRDTDWFRRVQDVPLENLT